MLQTKIASKLIEELCIQRGESDSTGTLYTSLELGGESFSLSAGSCPLGLPDNRITNLNGLSYRSRQHPSEEQAKAVSELLTQIL